MKIHPVTFEHHEELPAARPIRKHIFNWIVDTFLDPKQHNRVIDLGCGSCIFARLYRDKGFDVTAVDARTVRLPDASEMNGIKFIEQDIRDVDLAGFDIISNLGLLYHLTLEDQINLLAKTPAGTVTILETQIYVPSTLTEKGKKQITAGKEGEYWGAYYAEPGNHRPTASWNNTQSFWHSPKSLMRLLRKSGFKMVMPVNPFYVSIFASRGYYILFK